MTEVERFPSALNSEMRSCSEAGTFTAIGMYGLPRASGLPSMESANKSFNQLQNKNIGENTTPAWIDIESFTLLIIIIIDDDDGDDETRSHVSQTNIRFNV